MNLKLNTSSDLSKSVEVGYMLEQHITWLKPIIYRGMKGVGLEGYMFSQKNWKSRLSEYRPRCLKSVERERFGRSQKLKLKQLKFDGSNKGVLSITYSRAWNTLFQALEQLVPRLGIPPKEALEWSIEGISVESTLNSHRKCLTFTSKNGFFLLYSST